MTFLAGLLLVKINPFFPFLNTIQGFLDSFPDAFALTKRSGFLCLHLNFSKGLSVAGEINFKNASSS